MRFLTLLVLVACVGDEMGFRPDVTDAPSIYHIGQLEPVPLDELPAVVADPTAEDNLDRVHFGQLGADVDPAFVGGATFEFAGTGDAVCVILDPEAVFWSGTLQAADAAGKYKYIDIYEDDGDVDIDVGLTAYYTGSPGTEMGDFNAIYTDPTGVDHTLAFNECVQTNVNDEAGVHAGRGGVEYCEIDTSQREGTLFTAALRTFALPIDDSVLNYGVVVVDGDCGSVSVTVQDGEDFETVRGVSECVLADEVHKSDPDEEGKAWFPELERNFCLSAGKLNGYCKDHLLDDDPPCLAPQ